MPLQSFFNAASMFLQCGSNCSPGMLLVLFGIGSVGRGDGWEEGGSKLQAIPEVQYYVPELYFEEFSVYSLLIWKLPPL
jgi:hypothetical protein